MNLLRDAVESYSRIIDNNWNVYLRDRSLTLRFHKSNFMHLSGLGKIKDISLPQQPGALYSEALAGKITDNYIETSFHYYQNNIDGRLQAISLLEQSLPDIKEIYTFRPNGIIHAYGKNTTIKADYVMKLRVKKKGKSPDFYFFFRKDKNKPEANVYCPVSCFQYGGIDFTKNQKKLTVNEVEWIPVRQEAVQYYEVGI